MTVPESRDATLAEYRKHELQLLAKLLSEQHNPVPPPPRPVGRDSEQLVPSAPLRGLRRITATGHRRGDAES